MELKVAILTISDKGARGEREDLSGMVIREIMGRLESKVVDYEVIPDEEDMISSKLKEWADGNQFDVIITTGGTGLGPRDVTPEATLAVLDRVVPGMAEAMRAESFRKTPNAMLSRGTAGVRRQTLIINLPGSPRGVQECLEVVLPVLHHAVASIKGQVGEHPAS